MNKEIMREAGYGDHVQLVEENKCPICKADIDHKEFKDALSHREYEISGMCQKCQDRFFG